MSEASNADLIYSTAHWDIRLNPNQKYLGRCVIVLNRPCHYLSQVTQEEMLDFLEIIQDIEMLLKKTFAATMFNWACSMNNAYQEDPPNPQVHWHLIPRYISPVKFKGKVFSDENFSRRSVDTVDMIPDDIFKAIVDILKKNLNYDGVSGRIGAE